MQKENDRINEKAPSDEGAFSLSKNYPRAPVSGKIGTGVLLWKNGRKTHVEMWYSWTLMHWYRRIICCER